MQPTPTIVAFLLAGVLCAFAGDLKSTRTDLLGKWTISAERTLKLPVDVEKHPWISKKREQLVEAGGSWEFKGDGRVVESMAGRSVDRVFYLMHDDQGAKWLVIGKSDNFTLHRIEFVDSSLHLTPVAFDEDNNEVPIVGTLALERPD